MINEKNIKIFGLGLSLILAGASLLHMLHLHLGLLVTVLIFSFILFVIEKSLTWPWLFASIYVLIAIGSIMESIKHLPPVGVIVSDSLSVLFVLVVLLKFDLLIPLYNVWMKAAHLIGTTITTIILTTAYFFMFTPIRILLRLIGKDHLQRNLDSKQVSYWEKREKFSFSKERYQQQF